MKSTLTSKKIAALRPREKRFSVAIEKGLTLRVHPSGTKSWVLRIPQNNRIIDLTLGHFPDLGLQQAKAEARKRQKAFDIDPIKSYNLNDAFQLWCSAKKGRIVSYDRERRTIHRHLIQHLGNHQLDEISAPLVIKTVRNIEARGHQCTLKHVLMRLREILDLAVFAGYISHNPISKISKAFAPAVSHPMPSMDWRMLPAVMRVMKDAPPRLQNYFLFSLCSMLRPGEVAMLEKSWIDHDVITIPAESMKKRRQHRVPLSSLMKKLLEREKQFSPHPRNKYVFAGRKSSGHISKQALAKYLLHTDLGGQIVPHGFRSMARCWMADNDIGFEIAESCLSHVAGDKVYRAYQRSDFLESRRMVMERWSSYVLFCAASAGLLEETPSDMGVPLF